MKFSTVTLISVLGLAAAAPNAQHGGGDHGRDPCRGREWWKCCKWDHSHRDDPRCHGNRCQYRWDHTCCGNQKRDWFRPECCRHRDWQHDRRCRH